MNIGCGGSWRMLDLPGAEFLDELTRRRERGAAVDWLKRHPEVELVDFPGAHPPDVSTWQHAWFIFHRR